MRLLKVLSIQPAETPPEWKTGMSQSWWFGTAAFVVVSVALVLWIVLSRAFCKSPKSRETSWNAALAIFSIGYTLVVAELLFSLFFFQSHGVGDMTLASKRWAARYWTPTINSYGYRDREPVWSDHLLVMVGASFVAGGGIENLEDRMSGVLGKKLGKSWTVTTVTPGLDTKKQLEALLAYPKRPDIIVLAHTPVDIAQRARQQGLTAPPLVISPLASFRPLIDNSSLVNWLYWKYANQDAYGAYFEYIDSAYASPEVFAAHIDDLKKFKTYSDKIGAQLYYVVWPLLANLKGTEKINNQVADALHAMGAKVIDLTPRFVDRAVSDLVVNASDAHPNEKIHAEVGNIVFERLQKDGVHELQATLK